MLKLNEISQLRLIVKACRYITVATPLINSKNIIAILKVLWFLLTNRLAKWLCHDRTHFIAV